MAYHWLTQPIAGSVSTRAAICGLSPSAVPCGPNAMALTGTSVCARGVTVALGVAVTAVVATGAGVAGGCVVFGPGGFAAAC
ncbi:MAG: hypothetical protein WB688_12850 [Trebonia sp.]